MAAGAPPFSKGPPPAPPPFLGPLGFGFDPLGPPPMGSFGLPPGLPPAGPPPQGLPPMNDLPLAPELLAPPLDFLPPLHELPPLPGFQLPLPGMPLPPVGSTFPCSGADLLGGGQGQPQISGGVAPEPATLSAGEGTIVQGPMPNPAGPGADSSSSGGGYVDPFFGPVPDPAAAAAAAEAAAKAAASAPKVRKAPEPPSWLPAWRVGDSSASDSLNADDAAARAKRRKVEGLADSKSIKGGGSVTVYSGYSATKVAPAPAEKAPEAASQAQALQQQPQLNASAAQQALPRMLPEGWEMRKSRSSGKVYYINEKLGQTQWVPPEGSTLKVESVKKKKVRESLRAKDAPDASVTDQNGLKGLVRATEQKVNRWQKWQKTSRLINEPSPEKEE
eukprot:TRINITY_DN34387_c0_g1_i1.p1 TRINITY_DN34387_c0_g1~~TRINITY_DN34387_c0_g1_i1.p1  ORF type:complete len:442 (+),score=73.02 TRINITY_DN34387_c0_g1_i1:157-1326(+)